MKADWPQMRHQWEEYLSLGRAQASRDYGSHGGFIFDIFLYNSLSVISMLLSSLIHKEQHDGLIRLGWIVSKFV